MLKRGEADIVYLLQGELAEEVRRTPGLTLKPTPIVSTHWLVFADQWDPKSPWADRRVRLAANHAIDRQAVNEALTLGFSRITWSIIPQSFDFFWQPPAVRLRSRQGQAAPRRGGLPEGVRRRRPLVRRGDRHHERGAWPDYLQAAGIRDAGPAARAGGLLQGVPGEEAEDLVYSLAAPSATRRPASRPSWPRAGPTSTAAIPTSTGSSASRRASSTGSAARRRSTGSSSSCTTRPCTRPIWELGFIHAHGPRVAESSLGLITGWAFSAPYEDLKLKGK